MKGADLALYSSFESLGLNVEILPVLEGEEGYFTTNGGSSYYYYGDSGYMAYLKKGELRNIDYSELLPSSTFCADVDRRWKLLMLTRRVQGITDALDFAEKKDLPRILAGVSTRWRERMLGHADIPIRHMIVSKTKTLTV